MSTDLLAVPEPSPVIEVRLRPNVPPLYHYALSEDGSLWRNAQGRWVPADGADVGVLDDSPSASGWHFTAHHRSR